MPGHLEFLLEERSMEAFLKEWLPRVGVDPANFETFVFPGKHALLKNLQRRLKGYANWLPPDHRIVIVVDRDGDCCLDLKARLEDACKAAGLRSRRQAGPSAWQVVTRIAIEELEAWYFGSWEAVRKIYPSLPETVPKRADFRNPDAIQGGTWERFEKLLNERGYHKGGLRKVDAAEAIGACIDAESSRSPSFQCFAEAIHEVAP